MTSIAVRVIGVVAYAAFFAVFVYFMGFTSGVFVPKTVDGGGSVPLGLAVAVDLALVFAFGLVHSIMARSWFKEASRRFVPRAAERSLYVAVATAQIALLCWQWRPIASPVLWSATGIPALVLLAVGGVGWAMVLASSFSIDHFELFGLRQSFGREAPNPTFRTPILYRSVRHPLYFGILLGMWSSRVMSAGHVLLAASMTAYILIGVRHEERDLVRTFGDTYRDYQARVPMLLPGLRW